MTNRRASEWLATPLGLVVLVAMIAFAAELVVMTVFREFLVPQVTGPARQWTWDLLDAAVLGGAVSTALYFLIFRRLQADLRQRDWAAAEIATLTRRLELATAAAGVGIWEWNASTDTVIWDARMHDLHGVAPGSGTVTRTEWPAQVHPDDVGRVRERHAAALSGADGTLYEDEFRIVLPRGDNRWVKVTGTSGRAGAGRPPAMVGTMWDVTAHKRAEAVLARQNVELGVCRT